MLKTANNIIIALTLLTNVAYSFKISDNLDIVKHYEAKIKKLTLKNGLRIIMLERKNRNAVTLEIRYNVGSAYDKPNEIGSAHLLEHMMFRGTKQIGTNNYQKEKTILKKIFQTGNKIDSLQKAKLTKKLIQKIDSLKKHLSALQNEHKNYIIKSNIAKLYYASGGIDLNAKTNKDYTKYNVTLPNDKIELWANIESDRMKNLVLRGFYKERLVIIQERLKNYKTNSSKKLLELLSYHSYLIPPYKYYSIGTTKQIRYLNPVLLKRFYKKYYVPNNAIICAVGNFDQNSFIKIIKKYFAHIPPGKKAKPINIKKLTKKKEIRFKLFNKTNSILAIGYHIPKAKHNDYYKLRLLRYIMARPSRSVLYKALIKSQLCYSLKIRFIPGIRYSHLFVIEVKPKNKPIKLINKIIDDNIDKLKNTINKDSINWAKTKMLGDYIKQLSDDSILADNLIKYESIYNNYKEFFRLSERLDKLNHKDLYRVITKYFIKSNRVVGLLYNKK